VRCGFGVEGFSEVGEPLAKTVERPVEGSAHGDREGKVFFLRFFLDKPAIF